MSKPKVIVTIAPTGGMANKKENPNSPTQPQEIADDVYRCYNAGASVVAMHARRASDDEATCDPLVYGRMNELIRSKCDIVLNNSTGGGINGDTVHRSATDCGRSTSTSASRAWKRRAPRCALSMRRRYQHGELATNVKPMERMVRIVRELGFEPATPTEARRIMGLRPLR